MHFKNLLWMALFALTIASCKKWDDRVKVDNQDLNQNLTQAISSRTNLSKFYAYLQKTGLDKELASSKSYTVWAPVDAALQSLDPAIVGDSAKLRQFVANHISNQSYFTRDAQQALRVPMLNGKRVTFANNLFEDATIVDADKYMRNGVLHIIDKAIPALPNAWEFVNNTKTTYQQNAFILSLNFTVQDPALAVLDSINPVTGDPVYKPGTGLVLRNRFNNAVYDLKSEEKQYTYFILNDASYTDELNKLKPYYATGTVDSTTNFAGYEVVKDLAVEGVYPISQLPDTLISKFGVKIPVNKNNITQTIKLSNGIAYVMSGVNFSAKNKIPTVIIQGENPLAFYRPDGTFVDVRGTTFYRVRTHPVSGQFFNDIFIYNHAVSALNILYQARNLPSVKYKVYWVAVNDTIQVSSNRINPVAFNQKLVMGTRTATTFAYRSVAINQFNEVYLGDYTQTSYNTLNMFLTAAASTTAGVNSLTLDYIKLVPDIQ